VAKRQQQLQEIRDRLKDKHKKNELIKLKRALGSSGASSLENSFRSGANLMYEFGIYNYNAGVVVVVVHTYVHT
jgi:hypothetical protein